jgi:hypothetical protein
MGRDPPPPGGQFISNTLKLLNFNTISIMQTNVNNGHSWGRSKWFSHVWKNKILKSVWLNDQKYHANYANKCQYIKTTFKKYVHLYINRRLFKIYLTLLCFSNQVKTIYFYLNCDYHLMKTHSKQTIFETQNIKLYEKCA